jgi:hypothetical protein
VLRGDPPTIGAYEINCTLPETPTALNVDSTVCANTSYTFSVNPVAGATSYNWEVPIGTTVTAGQGTSEVTIMFGTMSGNVVVFANDSACGSSLPAQFMVTIDECSSVEDVALQAAVVYPNPFAQSALVEIPGNVKTVDVKLFDVVGREVQSFSAEGARFTVERNGVAAMLLHRRFFLWRTRRGYFATSPVLRTRPMPVKKKMPPKMPLMASTRMS